MQQQLYFENATEKANVTATLCRLIDDVKTRSHSTAEAENLSKALFCVSWTPVEPQP